MTERVIIKRSAFWPSHCMLDCVWNVMTHAQKPDFVFWQNGRVHLNQRGCQFSWLLAAKVCASAVVMVVMLDRPRSEVVWRVLATHSIRQFPLHFPSRASPCAIPSQLDTQHSAFKHHTVHYLHIAFSGLSITKCIMYVLTISVWTSHSALPIH
jgi:hypothetical protein